MDIDKIMPSRLDRGFYQYQEGEGIGYADPTFISLTNEYTANIIKML